MISAEQGKPKKHVSPKNKKSYSKDIRKPIEEVFGVKSSRETLRTLFKQLRKKYKKTVATDVKKQFYHEFNKRFKFMSEVGRQKS